MNFRWQELGIDISKVRGGKTVCPKCSDSRKNKKDPCLSVDTKEGLFHCHHCGWKGTAATKPKKEFIKPVARLEKLGDKSLKFFENDRKISNNTLLRFGITEGKEKMPGFETETAAICFNYYRDGELVNIKYRGPQKTFKLAFGAELIFYNLDAIKNETEAIIVEGEIDCLSMHEAGLFNSVSVPNGASKGSQRLEYLDNCWQEFEGKEKIFLCTDNDEAGLSLQEELARRLGKERCWLVQYPEDCKDANDVLIKHGPAAVQEMIAKATQYPLEGILTARDFAEEIEDYYLNGFPEGYTIGDADFDEHLKFASKRLTVITGIPGSGKDEVVNDIAVKLAKRHGWKFGVAGFEEAPSITGTKLIEKHAGLSFEHRRNPADRLTRDQLNEGLLFLDDYFFFVNTDESDITVEGVLNKFCELVKRYGINAIIMSPWNCFEHKRPAGMSETEYIGESIQRILRVLKLHNLHCFLIAHPTKTQKDKNTKKYEIPTLYSISGSHNWFSMTHNGICVYRDYETGLVTIYFQKVKFHWEGKLGYVERLFNTLTRQYSRLGPPDRQYSNDLPPQRNHYEKPEPELGFNESEDTPF